MLYVSCGGRSHDSPLGAGGAGRGGASAGMSAAAGKSGADGSAGSPSGLCACPAMPASQWIADESCVYEGTWGCPRSLKDALGYLVAETGGLWTRGCGRSVLAAPAAADEPNFCVYADDGSFVGAYRSEPKECPNVGMIATTGSELTCSSQTACWV